MSLYKLANELTSDLADRNGFSHGKSPHLNWCRIAIATTQVPRKGQLHFESTAWNLLGVAHRMQL